MNSNLSRRDEIALQLLKTYIISAPVGSDLVGMAVYTTDLFIKKLDEEQKQNIPDLEEHALVDQHSPMPVSKAAPEKKAVVPKDKKKAAPAKTQPVASAGDEEPMTIVDTRTLIIQFFESKDKESLEKLIIGLNAQVKKFPGESFTTQIQEAKLALQRYDMYDGEIPDIDDMKLKLEKYKQALEQGEASPPPPPPAKNEAAQIHIGRGSTAAPTAPEKTSVELTDEPVNKNADDEDF